MRIKNIKLILFLLLGLFVWGGKAYALCTYNVDYSGCSASDYDCRHYMEDKADSEYQACITAEGDPNDEIPPSGPSCTTTVTKYYGNGWFTGERSQTGGYDSSVPGTPCDDTFVPETTSQYWNYSDWDGAACEIFLGQPVRTQTVTVCN